MWQPLCGVVALSLKMKVRVLIGIPEFYWDSVRQVRNRVFDLRHRTDTCRKFIEADTRVMTGPNAVYGSQYAPVDAEALRKAIRSLRIRYSDYTLVDLGSGKGKAVMVAANFPFQSVVGIEYSRLLNRVARANLENPNRPFTRSRSVHIVHADAVHFPPPEGPLVVLLCDPFRGPVLRDMLQHLKSDIEENPRPLKLIYMNPEEPDLISSALGFWPSMQLVRRQHGVRIFNLDLARMQRQVSFASLMAEEADLPQSDEAETPVGAEAEIEVASVEAAAAAEAQATIGREPFASEPVEPEEVEPEEVEQEDVPAAEFVSEDFVPVVAEQVEKTEYFAEAEEVVLAAEPSEPVLDPAQDPTQDPTQDEAMPEPIAVVLARAGQVIEFPKRAVAEATGDPSASNGNHRRRGPVVETGQVAVPRAAAAAAGSRSADLSARTRPELTVQRSAAVEQDPVRHADQRREKAEKLDAAIREAVRYTQAEAEREAVTDEPSEKHPADKVSADSEPSHRKPPVVESGSADRVVAQKNGTHHHQQASPAGADPSSRIEIDPATDAALRTALYGESPNEWPEDK